VPRQEPHGTDIQNGDTAATVGRLATPALLLDKDRLDRNLAGQLLRIRGWQAPIHSWVAAMCGRQAFIERDFGAAV
jgi:hypothetical protein